MKIDVVPVEQATKSQLIEPFIKASPVKGAISIEQIFAEFLEMEVEDGAASADTIKSYLSQTKMYFDWCKNNLVPPLEADQDDIKLYRQYLINYGYKTSTIATRLTIVNNLYKAAIAKELISTNPAAGVKAPTERVDPASNISYLELDELELLLGEIESQLNQAKTSKQRLPLLRSRFGWHHEFGRNSHR